LPRPCLKLLAGFGLRKNTSLFHFHVARCESLLVPRTPDDMARCACGWMQEWNVQGTGTTFPFDAYAGSDPVRRYWRSGGVQCVHGGNFGASRTDRPTDRPLNGPVRRTVGTGKVTLLPLRSVLYCSGLVVQRYIFATEYI
jgi:hypothetical protein